VRKGKRLPLEALQPYLLARPEEPILFNWSDVFGNDHPVELEVGFGKGTFLVETAQSHPEINYVGIEIDRGLQLYVATRIAKRQLHNVRLLCGDARLVLRDHVPAALLQAVHVYFPDPWWKKRHRKRRVFTAEFAAECERVLQPGGRLHFASDVEEYFGVITQLVAERPAMKRIETPEVEPLVPSVEGVTNFQRKALAQGRSVGRAVFEKSAPSPPASTTHATFVPRCPSR
jgi:tRNA (guanine-N7-)-methyltransferase